MDLEAGQLVDDRFEILRPTGRGEWRRRYEVLDRSSGERFGLEIIDEAAARNAKRREDFLRQMRVARGLKHPNLLAIVELGEHRGSPYLLTEDAPGDSLATLLAREGRLGADELLPIARQLCAALGFLHAEGVIHRDVRPDALVLGADGNWKLRDFEMARDVGVQQTIALPGGAPPYRSPEQLLGRALDARSDIYAVGAVLFEALTGGKPLEGVDVISRFMRPPPKVREQAPDCPENLAAAVEKCLEAEVNQRFQSVAELERALAGQAAEPGPKPQPAKVEPQSPPAPKAPPPRRVAKPKPKLAARMGAEPGRTLEVVATLRQIIERLIEMRQEGLHHAPLSPDTISAPQNEIEIDAVPPPEPGQTVAIRQPKYRAPEWLLEAPIDGPDIERADLYALGFIAYEWLAGRDGFQQAFPHDDSAQPAMEWMRWQSNPSAQAPPLGPKRSWVPKALSELVGRMIAKNPSDALASYEEADQALASILARVEDTQHAASVAIPKQSKPAVEAGPPVWRTIAIVIALLALAVAAWWLLTV